MNSAAFLLNKILEEFCKKWKVVYSNLSSQKMKIDKATTQKITAAGALVAS